MVHRPAHGRSLATLVQPSRLRMWGQRATAPRLRCGSGRWHDQHRACRVVRHPGWARIRAPDALPVMPRLPTTIIWAPSPAAIVSNASAGSMSQACVCTSIPNSASRWRDRVMISSAAPRDASSEYTSPAAIPPGRRHPARARRDWLIAVDDMQRDPECARQPGRPVDRPLSARRAVGTYHDRIN